MVYPREARLTFCMLPMMNLVLQAKTYSTYRIFLNQGTFTRCKFGWHCVPFSEIKNYLGIQHKIYWINQLGKSKFINRNGWRTYSSCIDSVSPERLVTKERHDGCWALYKKKKTNKQTKKNKKDHNKPETNYMELKASRTWLAIKTLPQL